jgi:hypothetical protein|nr:hypothetical protein [Kiritimatiellia bacterium]
MSLSATPSIIDIKGKLYRSHDSDKSHCKKCVAQLDSDLCLELPDCFDQYDRTKHHSYWRELSYIERRRISNSGSACIAFASAAIIFILLVLYMLWVIISAFISMIGTEPVRWISDPGGAPAPETA